MKTIESGTRHWVVQTPLRWHSKAWFRLKLLQTHLTWGI